jgi:huntingtin-interacting protein 1-related protein
MTLQDQIDTFQRLIFAHIPHTSHSECRISALVPLVTESYGIYKFITNMLRAMHTTLGDDGALAPLGERYNMQHYRLVKFYYECSQLRYLTSLITVPKLPQDPPSLTEDEDKPGLPSRPVKEIEKPPSPVKVAKAPALDPEPINEFWKNQDAFAEEQRRLQEQLDNERRMQEERERQSQLDFENQQRLQAEQQRLEQERLAQQLQAQQTYGRLADLERENFAARARYEQDQLMLQQYDRKIKDLEASLDQLQSNYQQQSASKDAQIRQVQDEINTWRSKYEALAKLYSQLRTEHLELLQKFKGVQAKAASAQEAIDQREKLQRELKQKNLDLANMLRERDRALLDKDRLSGGHKDELEKLQRELRFAREQAENADRAKGSELSSMLNRHNREVTDLEEALRQKNKELQGFRDGGMSELEELRRQLREKDDQIEIVQAGMDQTILELNDLRQLHEANDQAIDGQLDTVIFDNIRKINELIDSVLQSGIQRVDDSIYELESNMQAGNQNASGAYVLSQIEKAAQSAMEFSTAFREFIVDGPSYNHTEIVRTVNSFSGAISDVLSDTKGLTRFASDERKSDQLVNAARKSAQSTIKFFRDLQSFRLASMDAHQQQDVIIHNNGDVQLNLQNLVKLADAFAPKTKITDKSGDLGDLVDREMTNAAKAIDAAAERLTKLMNKPRDSYSTYELRIHEYVYCSISFSC